MTPSLSPSKSRRAPIRRRVRQMETLADGKIALKTKSFSVDDGTTYEPIIDPHDGTWSCTCPDFVYRHTKCKHVRQAFAGAARKNQLDPEIAALQIQGAKVRSASEDAFVDEHVECNDEEYRAYIDSLCAADAPAPPPDEGAFVDERLRRFDAQIEMQRRIVDALERWFADSQVPGYAQWNDELDEELESDRAYLGFLESERAQWEKLR